MNIYWLPHPNISRLDGSHWFMVQLNLLATYWQGNHQFFMGHVRNPDLHHKITLTGKIKKKWSDFLFQRHFNKIEIFLDNLLTFQEPGTQSYWDFLIAKHIEIIDRIQKKKEKIDLIHAHFGLQGGLIAHAISQKMNIPYVITEHHAGFLEGPEMFQWVQEKIQENLHVYNHASTVFAVGEKLNDILKSWGVCYLSTLFNPTGRSFVSDLIPKLEQSPFYFFSLGRLHPQKGFEVLIQAIKVLLKDNFFQNHPCRFYIGGSGRNAEEYQGMVRDFGAQEYVIFLGALSQEEALKWYDKTHAFVLPSRVESFGIVYAEALARGRPVIATRCGEPENFINDKVGLIVEPDNPKELAKAIQEMVLHYSKYDSQELQDHIRPLVDPDLFCEKVMDYYRQALV